MFEVSGNGVDAIAGNVDGDGAGGSAAFVQDLHHVYRDTARQCAKQGVDRARSSLGRTVHVYDWFAGASAVEALAAGPSHTDMLSHKKGVGKGTILLWNMTSPPRPMEPYARHVIVCTGGYCSPERHGRSLYSQLAGLLQREGLLFGPNRVKRGETPCLGVCEGGPILVVYPEGIWYAGVTPALLERIVVEHLKHGRVVEDAVYHRLHL